MELIIDNYIYLHEVEKMPSKYYLEPYDAKSFYKKATVYEKGNIKVLVSYRTPVVMLVNGIVIKLQENTRDTLSHTTMRHINAFLRRNEMKTTCKKEWRSVPVG